MKHKLKFDETGDSAELQALFDSLASADAAAVAVAKPVAAARTKAKPANDAGDCPELEALFDAVAAEAAAPHVTAHSSVEAPDIVLDNRELFDRLGRLTRDLHETLGELGYTELLRETAAAIPDAGERLRYVTRKTEQAAARVLNAVDLARPVETSIRNEAASLHSRWEHLFRGTLSAEQFRELARQTCQYLEEVPKRCDHLDAQFHEITMAQDFQDLTGQVIKKLAEFTRKVEHDLLGLLVSAMPPDWVAHSAETGLINGPVINPAQADVVTDQKQVDDLLESLGF